MISAVYGYYGKLPISPEFLRLHAAGPELRWLDNWLQRGVLYAKAKEGPRWPMVVAESDLWNFMYLPSEHGRIVCGVLFASQDKAGRSFPFLTFLLLERESLSNNFWLAPVIAAEFLEGVTKLLQGLRKDLDWDRFCRSVETVGGTRINVESHAEGFAQYLRTTNAKEWWARLRAAFNDPGTHQLEHRLGTLIRSSKQYMNGQIPWGIKFPLFSTAAAERFDLAFWLAASVRAFSRGLQHEPGMFAFWSRSPTKVAPCLLISFGPGSPNLARFIVTPEAQDDSWHDLLPGEPGGENGIAHSQPQVPDDQNLSLEGLIDYLAGLA